MLVLLGILCAGAVWLALLLIIYALEVVGGGRLMLALIAALLLLRSRWVREHTIENHWGRRVRLDERRAAEVVKRVKGLGGKTK